MANIALRLSSCTLTEVNAFLSDYDVASLRGAARFSRNAAAKYSKVEFRFDKPYYDNPRWLHGHILCRLSWVTQTLGAELTAIRFVRSDWTRDIYHVPPKQSSNELSIVAAFGKDLQELQAGWIMTDIGMAAIKAMCPQLTKLYIPYASITQQSFLLLQEFNLTHLDLSGVISDDFQLSMICNIKTLEALNLRKCRATSAGLQLLSGLRNLQNLDLLEAPGVSDNLLIALAPGCPNLRKMIIGNQLGKYQNATAHLTNLTARGFKAIHGSSLEHLTCLGDHGPRYARAGAMRELMSAVRPTLRHVDVTVGEHHVSALCSQDGRGPIVRIWSRHSSNKVCNDEAELVSKAFPDVQALILASRLGAIGLRKIGRNCKDITYLSVGDIEDVIFDFGDDTDNLPDILKGVTRQSLLNLGQCKKIQILKLAHGTLSALKELPSLLSLLPSLRCLELGIADARDEDVRNITVAAPALEHFQLSAYPECGDCFSVGISREQDDDDAHSVHSSDFSDEEELEQARIRRNEVKAEQVRKAHLTDECFLHLSTLRSLRFLVVQGGRFSDDGLVHLAGCRELHDLCVRSVVGNLHTFTDKCSRALVSLPKLSKIVVRPGSVQTQFWTHMQRCCDRGGFVMTSWCKAPRDWRPTLHTGHPIVPCCSSFPREFDPDHSLRL